MGDGWMVKQAQISNGPWVIWKTDLVLVFDTGWCFWLMFGQTFSVFVSDLVRHDQCLLVLHSTMLIILFTGYTEYTVCYATICIAYHCFVIAWRVGWTSVPPRRMAWPEVLGVTGPTTPLLLCVPLRMSWVCRLLWVSGIQLGFLQMAALRTSSDVVRLSWSMVAFLCSQQWDILHRKSPANSLATCLLLLAWSLQTCPMVLPQSPKCQQQVGVRFWPTWPSAKFPRTSLLELLLQLVTLDGNSSHLLIRKSRKQSSMQSWQTEDWRWWPSLACSFRWWRVKGEWWWVMFKGWRVKGDGWWVNGETSSDIERSMSYRKTDLVLVFDTGWCFWLMFGQTFSVFVSDLVRHDQCLLVLHSTMLIILFTGYTEYTVCYATICIAYHCFVIVWRVGWMSLTPRRMAWPEVLGVTGPTTLLLLCVPLRMSWVCRLLWVSGIQLGFLQMAALRTSSDVVRLSWSMVAFLCSQQWDILHRKSPANSLATCLLLLAWSLQTCPMVLPQSPKCQQQVGVRFWPTWPSAKFPRTSLLELLLQLVTLDGSSSHLLIRKSRKQSSMQSWQTEDWRWWPSLACSFRWWRVKGEWWWVMFKGWRVKGDGWWVNGETSSDIDRSMRYRKTDLMLVFDTGWCFWLMFGQTFSVFVSYLVRHDQCLLVLHSTMLIILFTGYTEYTVCYATICIAYHCFVIVWRVGWMSLTPPRMAWREVLGVTGPTTLLLLCVPLRMSWVCRLLWVSGIQLGFLQMAALRTSSDVVRLSWSMVAFLCSQQWDILHRKSPANSLATCLLLLVWSLQTCPMVLPRSPKCQQQVGVRFWPTWPSAKFPRTSLLELLLQLVTLDGRSSHLLIRKSRKQSSMQSWQMEDWRWWPSLACSFRWWRVWWRVHGCLGAWWNKLRYRSISVTKKWSRI